MNGTNRGGRSAAYSSQMLLLIWCAVVAHAPLVPYWLFPDPDSFYLRASHPAYSVLWWPGREVALDLFPWRTEDYYYFGVHSHEFFSLVAQPLFGTFTLFLWIAGLTWAGRRLVRRFRTWRNGEEI